MKIKRILSMRKDKGTPTRCKLWSILGEAGRKDEPG